MELTLYYLRDNYIERIINNMDNFIIKYNIQILFVQIIVL